ncbi:homeobox protein PKNOX2-like [Ctenocephalides felis]|uniref:homeobox protein PKNOX2-like n=1 Tax=Ctenocephalides felis TaxID=7515 RepID=UPI000E6E1CCF|nr:homeobox protein PKNOX2-like [Ctenocephalides felis]
MQESALIGAEVPVTIDQAQFEADKRAVYKHPLFPLLALLLERCEQATQGCTSQQSNNEDRTPTPCEDSFSRDLQAFVQLQQRERRPLLIDEPELDGLMIKALQVLRIHLLELEKVQELCRDFCSRYIACLRGKMQSENLLRADYNGGMGPLEHNNNVGSSNSNSPTQLNNSPSQSLNAPSHTYTEENAFNYVPTNCSDQNNRYANSEPDYNNVVPNPGAAYMENSTSPALQASGSDSAGIVLGTTPIGQIGAGLMPPGADAYSGQLSPMPSTDDQESGGESVSGTSARRQKRGVLPKQATSVMRAWLFQHLVHPYPTEDEKRNIAAQTNLTLLQVNNWFINARRRILQPMLEATDGQSPRADSAQTSSVSQRKKAGSAKRFWPDNLSGMLDQRIDPSALSSSSDEEDSQDSLVIDRSQNSIPTENNH